MRRLIARGLIAAAKPPRRLAERVFERRYGVATADRLYLEDLGVEAEGRTFHVPSEWIVLSRALRRLGCTPDDVFCDFGSGLGRAVLIAAQFPFKRVIGVEVSPDMHARAVANVDAVRERLRCRDVELVNADATTWEVPDDLTVAYFYCPFLGDLFYRVIAQLLASVDRRPERALRVVYNFPAEHDYLIDTERFYVLDVIRGTWPPQPFAKEKMIVTYLALPQDEAARADLIRAHPRRVSPRNPWIGHHDPGGFLLRKPDRLGGKTVQRPSSGNSS